MSFLDVADEIHGEFAMPVRYTGAGLSNAAITAIKSDVAADLFQGPGETAREISFEVRQADLPLRPRKGELLAEGEAGDGVVWEVIQITPLVDVGAWKLVVSEATP